MSGLGSGAIGTSASQEWRDVAVGLSAASSGYVTHLSAALNALPGSLGGFALGIATADLIGISLSNYFSLVPGSLWEANVCSTRVLPPYASYQSACDAPQVIPGGPTVRLDAGEYFSTALNLYLPDAGTYWIYTRYLADDVFNLWATNPGMPTDLFAMRNGSVVAGERPEDRTFFQTISEVASPGYEVLFDPELEIPEPQSILMCVTALFGLIALRRVKRNG